MPCQALFLFFSKIRRNIIFVEVHGKLQLLPSCPNKKMIPSMGEKQFKRIQVTFNPQSNQTSVPDLCSVALLLANRAPAEIWQLSPWNLLLILTQIFRFSLQLQEPSPLCSLRP